MGKEGRDAFLGELNGVVASTAGMRRFGSAALDLAWTASGRFDAFWERHLQAWDIAAGILIVREAGGVVTDLDGRDCMMDCGHILAANDALHRPLLDLLRGKT
jgi:myo-inositol-1(or 4)-monophosphatase